MLRKLTCLVLDNGGDYRTVNPLGFVPALELDDGTVLTEGVAIVQDIADQVPATQLAPPNGTYLSIASALPARPAVRTAMQAEGASASS